MNVFDLRDRVADDYERYVGSFVHIADDRIRAFVHKEHSRGHMWPPPLVQLNPSYAMGKTVPELVQEGLLDARCERIFRKHGQPFHLFHHQEAAIRIALKGEPYVLTTGTSSGKSLTYMIPIVDHILKNNPEEERVRAIIVYPMNALINSQVNEITSLLNNLGESQDLIRFGRYTGQDSQDVRQRLQAHPPHILLTNYVMLELMMSRPAERVFLDRSMSNLEFLVLDELHTYTGRKGADVAMLVRRVRQRCGNDDLQCIGTSATMVSGGDRTEQADAVAEVASKIFGVTIPGMNVVDETLQSSLRFEGIPTPEMLRQAMENGVPGDYGSFLKNPLCAWAEQTFGIQLEDGGFKRHEPITLREGAVLLSKTTGTPIEDCVERLGQIFHLGSELRKPDGTPVFGVRLHQFFTCGDTVHSTFDGCESRQFTMNGQRFVKGEQGGMLPAAPLVFCRICGQEYYQASLQDVVKPRFVTGSLRETASPNDGYIVVDREDNPLWNESDNENLPENWFTRRRGRVKKEYEPFIPRRIYVSPDGSYSSEPRDKSVACWFLQAPLLLCLSCGEVYDRRTSLHRKFGRLSKGRSSATTIISVSTLIQTRQQQDLPTEARKLLSFMDNRQDASFQAGHFNDFVQLSLLRSGVYKALPESGGLQHHNMSEEVVKALSLPSTEYAKNPARSGSVQQSNEEALTEYLEYRIYQDLQGTWRLVQPNLEQCGLLKIEYAGVEELCRDDEAWVGHDLLSSATSETRHAVVRAVLDHLRRSFALDAECLKSSSLRALRRRVNQALKEPWNFHEEERLDEGNWFMWGTRAGHQGSLGPNSSIGRFLRGRTAWPGIVEPLNQDDYETLLRGLLGILRNHGYLSVEESGEGLAVQLAVASLRWTKGDGTIPERDIVRSRRLLGLSTLSTDSEVNKFFARFYQNDAALLAGLEAREHTGMTSKEDREDRERRFRRGQLECLYCSPTLELGIDIADLNCVNLRNVPPTPANYAQRSGRAGRNGRPAFVSCFCLRQSGHDRYFFSRPQKMVAGVVTPPRLDMANEDLLKSHIQAVWLADTGLTLGDSISNVLDLNDAARPLREEIQPVVNLSEEQLVACLEHSLNLLEQCQKELNNAGWYSPEWVESVVRGAAEEFNRAFTRWRELFGSAQSQLEAAQRAELQGPGTGLSKTAMNQVGHLRQEALRQRELLLNRTGRHEDSDFNPYRYLAHEGFLPGYNFPRLPIRAYIPRSDYKSEFIDRPRFLAISEFGPRNVIYHEGRKHIVTRSLVPPGGLAAHFTEVKLCKKCGAFHAGDDLDADLCVRCNSSLNVKNCDHISNLFEMTAVATERANRILSDEEIRLTEQYKIETYYRFSTHAGRERTSSARAMASDGTPLLSMKFGPAAELWRINHGWKDNEVPGFILNLSNGTWSSTPTPPEEGTESGDDLKTGVRVFVRDTRNILVVEGLTEAGIGAAAPSLQYALVRGLCQEFDIDEREIESAIIGEGQWQRIVYWEEAEGGIGSLERLVDEQDALPRIARRALEVCHFDPETGEERDIESECHVACYECLLSYRNQPIHEQLNRHTVQELLMNLANGSIEPEDDEA